MRERKLDHLRRERDIPFIKVGMRVEVDGAQGKIMNKIGGGLNLWVKFDGKNYGNTCHPWWRTTYFDKEGSIIRQYGDGPSEVLIDNYTPPCKIGAPKIV